MFYTRNKYISICNNVVVLHFELKSCHLKIGYIPLCFRSEGTTDFWVSIKIYIRSKLGMHNCTYDDSGPCFALPKERTALIRTNTNSVIALSFYVAFPRLGDMLGLLGAALAGAGQVLALHTVKEGV